MVRPDLIVGRDYSEAIVPDSSAFGASHRHRGESACMRLGATADRCPHNGDAGSVVACSGWLGITFEDAPQALQPLGEFEPSVIIHYRILRPGHWRARPEIKANFRLARLGQNSLWGCAENTVRIQSRRHTVVCGLLNSRIDGSGSSSGQRLVSGFGSIYLQDIGRDTHNILVISEPGFFKRKLSLLEACRQLRRGLGPPALKESLAREGRHAVLILGDELPIGIRQRADCRTFIRVALTSYQCDCMAPAT
jgi:hypothetical protein